jgi:hypothetical protein
VGIRLFGGKVRRTGGKIGVKIIVPPPTPSVATSISPTEESAIAGIAGSVQLQAQGAVPSSVTFSANGSWPAGISVSSSGLLSWTTSAIAAVRNLSVNVTNSAGTAAFNVSLTLVSSLPPSEIYPGGLTHTLQNTSGSDAVPAASYYSWGQPFAPGEVPSGDRLVVRVSDVNGTAVDAQFDQRTFHEDGSLSFCAISIRTPSSIAAGGTMTLWVGKETNPWTNTSSYQASNEQAATDFRVKLASVTRSFSGAYGDVECAINGGTWARVRQGPICDEWMVTRLVSTFFVFYTHIRCWKNAGGTVTAREVLPRVVNGLTATAGGEAITSCNVSLLNGASAIAGHDAGNSNYSGRWVVYRGSFAIASADGSAVWIGGTRPTLIPRHNQQHWNQTRMMPPYSTAAVSTMSTTVEDYRPSYGGNLSSDQSNVGGRAEIGYTCEWPLAYWVSPNLARLRQARINALCFSHWAFHYIDDTTLRYVTVSTTDFFGAGTAKPNVQHYIDNTLSAFSGVANWRGLNGNNNSFSFNFNGPGTNFMPESRHCPDIYRPLYLLTGDVWWRDLNNLFATHCMVNQPNYSATGNTGRRHTIDSTTYQPLVVKEVQYRGRSWSLRYVLAAYSISTGDERQYWREVLKQNIEYLHAYITQSVTPTEVAIKAPLSNNWTSTDMTPWQWCFMAMQLIHAAWMLRGSGLGWESKSEALRQYVRDWAVTGWSTQKTFAFAPYFFTIRHVSGGAMFTPLTHWMSRRHASVVYTSGSAQITTVADSFSPVDPVVNGVFRLESPPAPFADNVLYYVKSVSGTHPNFTVTLSATPGGAEIVPLASLSGARAAYRNDPYATTTSAGPDDYSTHALGLMRVVKATSPVNDNTMSTTLQEFHDAFTALPDYPAIGSFYGSNTRWNTAEAI